MSEQCRVKLIAGRVKNQSGVDGIADVITSLFLNQLLADHLKHALQEEVKKQCSKCNVGLHLDVCFAIFHHL